MIGHYFDDSLRNQKTKPGHIWQWETNKGTGVRYLYNSPNSHHLANSQSLVVE
jgi:hypothetical protein